MVADAWSRRSHVSQLEEENIPFELCEEVDKLNPKIVANTEVMEMKVDCTLLQDIQECQVEDEKIQEIKRNIKRSHPHLQKTTMVCCSTKDGFVCLISRSWRI
jgi:hypothetical protein